VDRTRTLFIFLVASLTSAQAWGLTAADGVSQTPASLNGAYVLRFNVFAGSTLESGSTVTCRAWIHYKIAVLDGVLIPAAVVSVSGRTAAGGSTATPVTCAIEMPLSWTTNRAPQGMVLSYEVEALPAAGLQLATRVVSQPNIPIVSPQAGGIASMTFNVVF
jgi:hypothetical protein